MIKELINQHDNVKSLKKIVNIECCFHGFIDRFVSVAFDLFGSIISVIIYILRYFDKSEIICKLKRLCLLNDYEERKIKDA